MRTLWGIGTAIVVVMGSVAAAGAQVSAGEELTLSNSVMGNEFINILENLNIAVRVDAVPEEAARAEASITQNSSQGAYTGGQSGGESKIESSMLDNTGILNVNQATGDLNNQGNSTAYAVSGADGQPMIQAQASATQNSSGNSVNISQSSSNIAPAQVSTRLEASINSNSGIANLNQAAGNLNNQANTVALVTGLQGTAVALSDARLNQASTMNSLAMQGTAHTTSIIGSLNGNTGIICLNQSSGSLNNQANVVSITFVNRPSFRSAPK